MTLKIKGLPLSTSHVTRSSIHPTFNPLLPNYKAQPVIPTIPFIRQRVLFQLLSTQPKVSSTFLLQTASNCSRFLPLLTTSIAARTQQPKQTSKCVSTTLQLSWPSQPSSSSSPPSHSPLQPVNISPPRRSKPIQPSTQPPCTKETQPLSSLPKP